MITIEETYNNLGQEYQKFYRIKKRLTDNTALNVVNKHLNTLAAEMMRLADLLDTIDNLESLYEREI